MRPLAHDTRPGGDGAAALFGRCYVGFGGGDDGCEEAEEGEEGEEVESVGHGGGGLLDWAGLGWAGLVC